MTITPFQRFALHKNVNAAAAHIPAADTRSLRVRKGLREFDVVCVPAADLFVVGDTSIVEFIYGERSLANAIAEFVTREVMRSPAFAA